MQSAKVPRRERAFYLFIYFYQHGGHTWSRVAYPPVPNTKSKSDLWKHFSLRKQNTDGRIDVDVAVCKHRNSTVKPARGTSKISTHMKRNQLLLLLFVRFCLLPRFLTDLLEAGFTGSFHWLSACPHLSAFRFLYRYGHEISVGNGNFFLWTGTQL